MHRGRTLTGGNKRYKWPPKTGGVSHFSQACGRVDFAKFSSRSLALPVAATGYSYRLVASHGATVDYRADGRSIPYSHRTSGMRLRSFRSGSAVIVALPGTVRYHVVVAASGLRVRVRYSYSVVPLVRFGTSTVRLSTTTRAYGGSLPLLVVR
eukprot:scaffold3269_cov17-Prasinocladus_malaysianus.AAC.1